MQSSLVDLRTECDAKTQSLECVSSELVKMKISRSEVCEESKHVLNWLRRWMREQKLIATELREKLLRISSEKRVAASALKILKRTNRVLAKRLKFIRCRPPVVRQTVYYSSPASLAAKSPVRQRNGFHLYSQPKETSNGTYSYFRREYREDPVNNIAGQGDCTWFGTMEHLAKEVPRTPQINESTLSDQRVSDKDYGYQTSGSK
ncbi:uncharacterized protein LOC106645484 [Copidosoma floridanum]|uniref:uncharacterized protein LOC106645484 n=1 Tax=Copidosoma floridanum TaxID=29053 RepID=UPI0006C9A10A|nr:uncharacterized protein LOC106645484 [Copidosoma floridanum]